MEKKSQYIKNRTKLNPSQQEQFGRMWTGGLAETSMTGSTMPITHPRTPGGHNSVRLSPTARQEYEAYMQNRIRMATQQQQQQHNRMRPPTTIIGVCIALYNLIILCVFRAYCMCGVV